MGGTQSDNIRKSSHSKSHTAKSICILPANPRCPQQRRLQTDRGSAPELHKGKIHKKLGVFRCHQHQSLPGRTKTKTKIPTNNAAGYKLQPLDPRYFGFPVTSNIKVIYVFSACRFKSQEQLEALVHRDEEEADFRLEEGSYLRLRRAMQFVTGMSERCEGVKLSFPMTIPALDTKPLKYSSSSLRTFTGKIIRGSQKFRAILTRKDDFIDDASVQSWRNTLQSEHITKLQVRNAFKLTSWKHFDAEIRDKILRFLTKKTIFNAQIERAYILKQGHPCFSTCTIVQLLGEAEPIFKKSNQIQPNEICNLA